MNERHKNRSEAKADGKSTLCDSVTLRINHGVRDQIIRLRHISHTDQTGPELRTQTDLRHAKVGQ